MILLQLFFHQVLWENLDLKFPHGIFLKVAHDQVYIYRISRDGKHRAATLSLFLESCLDFKHSCGAVDLFC